MDRLRSLAKMACRTTVDDAERRQQTETLIEGNIRRVLPPTVLYTSPTPQSNIIAMQSSPSHFKTKLKYPPPPQKAILTKFVTMIAKIMVFVLK